MGEPVNHSLLVSFPDQTPAYSYGFEAGMLWARMEAGDHEEFEVTTRVENREVVYRMAVASGWGVEVHPSGVEGWDQTLLHKKRPAPQRANPKGLRIVSGGLA